MTGIPGKFIYHYSMDISIKYIDNVEKDDLLVITTYTIHAKIHQFYNN